MYNCLSERISVFVFALFSFFFCCFFCSVSAAGWWRRSRVCSQCLYKWSQNNMKILLYTSNTLIKSKTKNNKILPNLNKFIFVCERRLQSSLYCRNSRVMPPCGQTPQWPNLIRLLGQTKDISERLAFLPMSVWIFLCYTQSDNVCLCRLDSQGVSDRVNCVCIS